MATVSSAASAGPKNQNDASRQAAGNLFMTGFWGQVRIAASGTAVDFYRHSSSGLILITSESTDACRNGPFA
jgi:hypothetical protein